MFRAGAGIRFAPGKHDEQVDRLRSFYNTHHSNSCYGYDTGKPLSPHQKYSFLALCTLLTCATAAPAHYHGRLRGTTLGRDRTTSALVPRSSPSGFFSPTGIAVIDTLLPDPPAAVVGAPPPTPDIAGVAI